MSDLIETDGIKQLKAIANKTQDPETANRCFHLFVSNFEPELMKYAEISASKNGFSEETAFAAVQCAFAKVWMYPTFSLEKSRCKNEYRAILIWLQRIAYTQMCEYVKKNTCAQVTPEEDLSVIEDASSCVEILATNWSIEEKVNAIRLLENRLSRLDEKHQIIYLTYMAYSSVGKKLPRTLLEKLRTRLQLTQATIRVYKKEAIKIMQDP